MAIDVKTLSVGTSEEALTGKAIVLYDKTTGDPIGFDASAMFNGGEEGIQGPKGDTGPQGDKGDKGDTGAAFTYSDFTAEQLAALKGPKGDTGAQGNKGDKGDTGAQGPKGDTGAQGPKGDTGAQGDKGDTGAAFAYSDFTAEQLAALKGPKGDKGDKGDKGEQGDKGDKGDTGEAFTYSDFTPEQLAALKGPKGDQGPQGDKGDKGDKGDTGEKGADGTMTFVDLTPEQKESLKGDKGDKGDTGAAFAYSDFTAEQLAALKGPKGDKGAQGDKGDKGDKGVDGYTPIKDVDYFDGVKGDKGDKGEQGIQGEQGLQGEPGINATTTEIATPTKDGLMSSSDKGKLNGVASGAQKNSDITKAEIEAKLTGAITTHTHAYAPISHTHNATDINAGTLAIARIPTGTTASTVSLGNHAHSNYVPTSRTVAGKALTANITLAKGDVGLGSVDNTSDANKPVSTAQQTALNAKMDSSKFQVVESLPASPVSGTFYFVKE